MDSNRLMALRPTSMETPATMKMRHSVRAGSRLVMRFVKTRDQEEGRPT